MDLVNHFPMKAVVVNIHDAKTHLSRLLEQVEAGQEIILARAGKPCAKLVPLGKAAPSRQPGRLAGRVTDAFFDPLPPEEIEAWAPR